MIYEVLMKFDGTYLHPKCHQSNFVIHLFPRWQLAGVHVGHLVERDLVLTRIYKENKSSKKIYPEVASNAPTVKQPSTPGPEEN